MPIFGMLENRQIQAYTVFNHYTENAMPQKHEVSALHHWSWVVSGAESAIILIMASGGQIGHAKLTPAHTQNRPIGGNSIIFPATQRKSCNFADSAPALRLYLCTAAPCFPVQDQLSPAARLKCPKSYRKSMKTASRLQKLPSTNTSFSPLAVHNFEKFEKQPQSRIQPDLYPRPCDRESRNTAHNATAHQSRALRHIQTFELINVQQDTLSKICSLSCFSHSRQVTQTLRKWQWRNRDVIPTISCRHCAVHWVVFWP